MASPIEGYNLTTILELLIETLVKKNILTETEANYIKQAGKGASFRQNQAGYDQTGQAQG